MPSAANTGIGRRSDLVGWHDPQFGYTSMPWPGYHVGYAIGDVFGLKNFDALIEGINTGPPIA